MYTTSHWWYTPMTLVRKHVWPLRPLGRDTWKDMLCCSVWSKLKLKAFDQKWTLNPNQPPTSLWVGGWVVGIYIDNNAVSVKQVGSELGNFGQCPKFRHYWDQNILVAADPSDRYLRIHIYIQLGQNDGWPLWQTPKKAYLYQIMIFDLFFVFEWWELFVVILTFLKKKGNENFPISVVMPPLMKHEAV